MGQAGNKNNRTIKKKNGCSFCVAIFFCDLRSKIFVHIVPIRFTDARIGSWFLFLFFFSCWNTVLPPKNKGIMCVHVMFFELFPQHKEISAVHPPVFFL